MVYLDISGDYNEYCEGTILSVEYAFYEQLKRENDKLDIKRIPRRFNSKQDYCEAIEYLVPIFNRVLMTISGKWNRLFNADISKDQMRILIGHWLYRFLFCFYDHYLAIKEAVKLTDDIFSIGMEPAFYDGSNHDTDVHFEYHTKLYSFICEEFGIRVNKKATNDYTDGKNLERLYKLLKYPRFYPYYFMKIMRRLVRTISSETTQVEEALGTNIMESDSLLLRVKFLPSTLLDIVDSGEGTIGILDEHDIRKMFREVHKDELNADIRTEGLLEDFIPKDHFETLVKRILPRVIPTEVLENFGSYWELAKDNTRGWKIRKIYTTECGGIYEGRLLLSAMSKSTPIYNIQHSGMLGFHEGCTIDERITMGEMLTWGWSSRLPYGMTKPVAMSRRYPKAHRIKKKHGRLLLVTNAADSLFEAGYGVNYDEFCDKHFRFINALPRSARKKLVVRIEMYEQMNPIKYQYATKYKDIKLTDRSQRPFEADAQMSEVVICDIVSSSHLEALVLGVPVLFFDACHSYFENEDIKKELDELYKVQVYAKTPEELADTITKISNFEEWWNRPHRQQAIQRYLNVSACDADGHEKRWVKEINDRRGKEYL